MRDVQLLDKKTNKQKNRVMWDSTGLDIGKLFILYINAFCKLSNMLKLVIFDYRFNATNQVIKQ